MRLKRHEKLEGAAEQGEITIMYRLSEFETANVRVLEVIKNLLLYCG
jgi:hypothetical protein